MSQQPEISTPLVASLCSNILETSGRARDFPSAIKYIDDLVHLIEGPVAFSINLNVTTRTDKENEVLLERIYSSNPNDFPVGGKKRKTLTPWTYTLFGQGQVFVGEGAETLAEVFDDYASMAPLGLNTVVNVPILQGTTCVATFNVFGTRGRWRPHVVVSIRLLALLASRWINASPNLQYTLNPTDALNKSMRFNKYQSDHS